MALGLLCAGAEQGAPPRQSKLVHPGPEGKLIYEPYTEAGDRIPDFSNCGYKGGGVAIPKADVEAVVEPVEGDDTASIQAAVDRVSKLPVNRQGLRGAVLLRKGRYEVSGSIRIAASGVVLRGEGQGEDGTVLVATGNERRPLILVSGEGAPVESLGGRKSITDDCVPVGARSFQVDDAAGFKVGQRVMVRRPSTAEWIHEIGMDRIPRSNSTTVQWAPGSKDLAFDRVITAVRGNKITVDAPIVNAIEKRYGGGFVYGYDFPGRITNVGIENLRGESEFDISKKDRRGPIDEEHSWDCVAIDKAENAWVKDVTSIYFAYSCVNIRRYAKWVTVEGCSCLEPASKIEGGRRYSFAVAGQLCLVKDCYSRHSRHDFVLGASVPGPNVFLRCKAEESYCTSEPHHRWSAGVLYDNVSIEGAGYLQAVNRGNSGTGHGWSGAQIVFWNCRAPVVIAQKPPTAQNFIIGSSGRINNPGLVRSAVNWVNNQCGSKFKPEGHIVGDCHIESPDGPVEPRSLYEQQLEDRLGKSDGVVRI